jgi:bacillithiol synthase
LVLRNSFLVIEKKWQEKIVKLGVTIEAFFQPAEALLNKIVERDTKHKVRLNGAFEANEQFYEQLKKQSAAIDATLVQHIDALKARAIHRLQELEKKMLRAEKRKFSDQQRQIQAIRERLFPNNGLQERVDNFMPYYAKWGKGFIQKVLDHSLSLEHEFVVLQEA